MGETVLISALLLRSIPVLIIEKNYRMSGALIQYLLTLADIEEEMPVTVSDNELAFSPAPPESPSIDNSSYIPLDPIFTYNYPFVSARVS